MDCQKPTTKTNGQGQSRKPRGHGVWFPTRSVNTVISDLLSTRDQSAILSAPVTDIVQPMPGIDGNFLAT